MKFKSTVLTLTLMVMAIISPVVTEGVSAQEKGPQILINNSPIKAEAFINEQGRTMVPVSLISSALGYDFEWIPESKTINIWDFNNDISLQVGNPRMAVNYDGKVLDSPPVIVNGRTMIPLNAVASALGVDVEWNNDTKSVEIYTNRPLPDASGRFSAREYLRTKEQFPELISLVSYTTYDMFITNPTYRSYVENAKKPGGGYRSFVYSNGFINEIPNEDILTEPDSYEIAIMTENFKEVIVFIKNTDKFRP